MEKQQDLPAPPPSFDAAALIASLPQRPGVYRMFDRDGGLLYVGKAGNLKRRVSSYFHQRQLSPRIAHMVAKVSAVEFSITASETEALLLEIISSSNSNPAITFCLEMIKPILTCA